MDQICPIVAIGTILKKKNNNCISLFINVEDRPSISSKLPYSTNSVNKKEVSCNDNTGTIKLTLWESCIDYVNGSSSVSFVQQAKVREWPKEILSITTTHSVSINPSKETGMELKSSLKGLISYSEHFPPTSVKITSSIECFLQCGTLSAHTKSKLVTMEHCEKMALVDET